MEGRSVGRARGGAQLIFRLVIGSDRAVVRVHCISVIGGPAIGPRTEIQARPGTHRNRGRGGYVDLRAVRAIDVAGSQAGCAIYLES